MTQGEWSLLLAVCGFGATNIALGLRVAFRAGKVEQSVEELKADRIAADSRFRRIEEEQRGLCIDVALLKG